MANSNGKIYVDTSTTPNTGVSINDVKTVTGSSSTDLATLCTSANVNMWSRKKPVPISTISHGETITGQRYSVTGSVNSTNNPWYLGELVELTSRTGTHITVGSVNTSDNKAVSLYPIAGMWVPVIAWNGDISYVTNAIDDMSNSSTALYANAWKRVDWGIFNQNTGVNTYGLPSRLQDFNGYSHNAEYENGIYCDSEVYNGATIPIWTWGQMDFGKSSLSLADIAKAFANDFELGVILKSTVNNTTKFYQTYRDSEDEQVLLKDWDIDICFTIDPTNLGSDYVGTTWYAYMVARFVNNNNYYYLLPPITSAHPNPVSFFVSNTAAVNPFSSTGVNMDVFYHIPYPNFAGHWVEHGNTVSNNTNENLYVGIGDYGKYCVAIKFKNYSSSSETIDFSKLSFYWHYCGGSSAQVQGKGGKEDFDIYLWNSAGNTTKLTSQDLSITWAANEEKILIFDFGQQGANGTSDSSSTSVFTALNHTTYDLTNLESGAQNATYTGFFDLESEMMICYENNNVDAYIGNFTVHALYISQASGLRSARQDRILNEDGTLYTS